jgi:hypothetical protein
LKKHIPVDTKWITMTAVFVALLVAVQVATAPLGQLATGSLVNLILIVSAMICGMSSGMTVALISPIAAGIIGVGPTWAIVPFIMAGNAAIVSVWRFIGKKNFAGSLFVRITAMAAAALCKFLVLYIGVVRIAAPYILNLPEPQAARVTAMFSLPQLFTALIGGAAAVVVLPILEKAYTKRYL